MTSPRDIAQPPTVKLRAFVDALLTDFELVPRAPGVTVDALIFAAEIKAEPSLLRLLLTNLIGEALRRAPAGTSVSVVVSPRGRYTEFRIADEAAREITLAAGAKSDEKSVGMTFCRVAAEANGGRLSCTESAVGTVLCLAFPTGVTPTASKTGGRRADDKRGPGIAGFKSGTYPLAPDRENAAARHTILVVDDEPLVRRFVLRTLNARGYVTLDADSAESALEILRDERQSISLLLTDVGLPGASGAELSRRAQTLIPGLPTLLMSANSAALLAQRGVVERESDLLQKPFEIAELLERIENALLPSGAPRAGASRATHGAGPFVTGRELRLGR